MDFGLTGRTALITGGSHGIGLATAKALRAEGCNVAITGRDSTRLVNAVAELCTVKSASPTVVGIPADATKPHLIPGVLEQAGRVDILVNNVGGGGRRYKGVVPHEAGWNGWREVMEQNYWTASQYTMAVLPGMQSRFWGRVIAVSSIHGIEAGGLPWFAGAKSAQVAMMKSLSQISNYVQKGITFNTVAPGQVWIAGTRTEEEAVTDKTGFSERLLALPMGLMGDPEDVANVIVFLASKQASWVNGACIVVDGGESRRF